MGTNIVNLQNLAMMTWDRMLYEFRSLHLLNILPYDDNKQVFWFLYLRNKWILFIIYRSLINIMQVMEQFFDLVNTFLQNNRDTWRRRLRIRTYKVDSSSRTIKLFGCANCPLLVTGITVPLSDGFPSWMTKCHIYVSFII